MLNLICKFAKNFLFNRTCFFAFILTVFSVMMTVCAFFDIFYHLYFDITMVILLKSLAYYCFYFCFTFFFYALLSSIPRVGVFLSSIVFLGFNAVTFAYKFVTGYVPHVEAVWMLYGTPCGMLGENMVHLSWSLIVSVFLLPLLTLTLVLIIFFKWSPLLPSAKRYATFFYAFVFLSGIIVIIAMYPKRILFETTSQSLCSLTHFVWECNVLQVERRVLPPREPSVERPKNNILFVIDESIRGDYLTINNPSLQTTPFLNDYITKYTENSFNYGIAVSATTQSLGSTLCLLSQVDSLPDSVHSAIKAPLIWQEAQRRGYDVAYFDLQGGYPNRFISKSEFENCSHFFSGRYIDARRPVYEQDFVIAERIHDILSRETGYFIVMVKIGAHFQYEGKYPSDSAVFIPHLKLNEVPYEAKGDARRALINSYKNLLRYNVDEFFRIMLSPLPNNTTIIYTSDHAQSLMESGVYTAPHGGTAKEQTYVPFLVISNDSAVQKRILKPELLNGVHLSHFNIWPTLFSMFHQYQKPYTGSYSSLFSEKFCRPELKYTNKLPWHEEGVRVISQDEIMRDTSLYLY